MMRAVATAGASSKQPALKVIQLEKVFGGKDAQTRALDGVSLSVDKGEFVAIMGPSGSGKSTLLNCIATVEKKTAGSILLDGEDAATLKGARLADYRSKKLGFIFQDSNLIETLTGFENIALPLSIQGVSASEIDRRVLELASSFAIQAVLEKLPGQMSGGQRQRVAAARAIVTKPALILADEPTGALDSRNAEMLLRTLDSMNKAMGATILMVTHDAYAASFATRVVFIKDGRVFTEVAAASGRKELFADVMRVQSFLSGEARDDA